MLTAGAQLLSLADPSGSIIASLTIIVQKLSLLDEDVHHLHVMRSHSFRLQCQWALAKKPTLDCGDATLGRMKPFVVPAIRT